MSDELERVKRIGAIAAFPQNYATINRINNEAGMTLRQYAAIAAMQGMLADPDVSYGAGRQTTTLDQWVKALARESVAVADALLAELAK